jgi:phosphoserine phosphatase RsbU/P
VSDGIVEAHRAGRELFGFDRLEQTLSEYDAALGPDELIAMLVDRVTQFMDGAEQHDDMTIVVIQPNLSVAVTEQDALPMHELAV